MSKSESVSPDGMPTHPPKVVVHGVPPGPLADQLIGLYQSRLNRFHAVQQQMISNGGDAAAVYRSFRDLGGAQASYSNMFGQETVTLTVNPEIIKAEERRLEPPDYWKWALIELEIADMVGFVADLLLEQTSGGSVSLFESSTVTDPPPTVEDSSYTLSLLVDMTNVGGQIIEFSLSGQVRPRTVVGGAGDFQGQVGTIQGSDFYGSQSINNSPDSSALPGPTFTPDQLLSASLYNNLAEASGRSEEAAANLLAATFSSWIDATDYHERSSSHTQVITWHAVTTFEAGPTGWIFGYIGEISGVDPNSYSVFPYGLTPTITYWDPDDENYIKTRVYLGWEGDLGPTWPVPSPANNAIYNATFMRGTDFYVPTWLYDKPRTGQLRAVCAKVNEWTVASRRYKEGEFIVGEGDLPVNECYRWETGSFPRRPAMEILDGALPIQSAFPVEMLPLGTLKIDTNSGKVTFIRA